jgi:arginine utilization regulatory protein
MKGNMIQQGTTRYTFDNITGNSSTIKEVIESAKRASRTSSYVLIVGETGTGKELFAQSIHNASSRFSAPFISQNCAALPDNLIESLLFGTKRGAFTGAIDQPGLFEQANGGTLLLDEINSLNLNLQAKLLRVLQEKTIRRVGDTKDTPVDVRVIANMNEDPIDAITNNRMRKDLFYRLGVVTIFIPPLRERKEDIPLLVKDFIDKYNERFQMNVKGLSEDVKQSFMEYDWNGNIRELEHIIEAAMNIMMDDEEVINYSHLPYHYHSKMQMKERMSPISTVDTFIKKQADIAVPLKEQTELFEKSYIEHVWQENDFNITKTASLLGLSRQSLQYRMKKLNMKIK